MATLNVVRFFEAKELAEGLRSRGHDVSDRTVQRWKAGESQPKQQDLAAIWQLLEAERWGNPLGEWGANLQASVDAMKKDLSESVVLDLTPEQLIQIGIREAEKSRRRRESGGTASSAGGAAQDQPGGAKGAGSP